MLGALEVLLIAAIVAALFVLQVRTRRLSLVLCATVGILLLLLLLAARLVLSLTTVIAALAAVCLLLFWRLLRSR
jgi:hypothetical protein